MSKHTPGPWEVYQLNHVNNELWLIIGHDGRGPITKLCGEAVKEISPIARMRFLITPDKEQRANARLIAAAPDLLDACKALLLIMDCGDMPRKLDEALTWRQNDEKARSLALAAIAKAEAASE